MKTLAITVETKKQELLFTQLAQELGIEVSEARFKPLTTKNAVLGMGKKFTKEELDEYLQRTAGGKPKSAEKVKRAIRSRISKSNAAS